VAIGFQPVRERVQRVANRLVYGERATPYEVLARFSQRVAESYAAQDVLPRMAQVLQEGASAERATVWLHGGEQLRPVATYPASGRLDQPVALRDGVLPDIPGATRAVAVRHQDALLGALSVVKRRGESITPMEVKLIDDLATQAGLVLKNVGLSADLAARLEELRASRQRLVHAQDEERRRIERNLHDGAQLQIKALKAKLAVVNSLLERAPAEGQATLSALKADADGALEALRDLARGIYPPLLADKGLTAALEAQARKATIPVSVDTAGTGRYPQEIEAAVYFCVLEALQNAQKHACAHELTVRVSQLDGMLRFDVEDDGKGFDMAAVRHGSGITNMMDRLDSLGGSLVIETASRRGARVHGSLPLNAGIAKDAMEVARTGTT
jgi:signal transduction histidine kinase